MKSNPTHSVKSAIRSLSNLEFAVVWLTSYLHLTGQIILVALIAWGGVGRGLGFDSLFWAQDRGDQFAGGLATSLLFGELWILRYILDERCAGIVRSIRWTLFPGSAEPIRKLG